MQHAVFKAIAVVLLIFTIFATFIDGKVLYLITGAAAAVIIYELSEIIRINGKNKEGGNGGKITQNSTEDGKDSKNGDGTDGDNM